MCYPMLRVTCRENFSYPAHFGNMKASILTSTAALGGLTPLSWNSFSQAGTGSYVSLSALFVPATITVAPQEGSGRYPNFYYQFGVSAGVIPAWIKPGVGVSVVASVTIGGVSYDVSNAYIVKSIDTVNGAYFIVNAPSPSGGRNAVALTQSVSSTNLDNTSGAQPNPAVSLIMQAQKAMFGASVGSVTIAPVVDHNGGAPNSEVLTSGQAEYEVDAPTGAKFDLADWSFTGTGTLYVRFL